MDRRSIVGTMSGALATIVLGLALVPEAEARSVAKFDVLSVSGTSSVTRNDTYESTVYGPCSVTKTEHLSFHSTKRITAYVFSAKSHGRTRVAWSPDATLESSLSSVEVPGKATVSRSATYEQTYDEQGNSSCHREFSPTNCAVERTVPVTLEIGGAGGEPTTYVQPEFSPGDLTELQACSAGYVTATGPGLFSTVDLFDKKQKRLRDTDRVEEPVFENPTDGIVTTGTIVQELAGELKRRKLKR